MFEQTWNDKSNEIIKTGEFSTCIYIIVTMTVLATIANNQFDKQNSSKLPKKGVLDVLDCQHLLFGNVKRLFGSRERNNYYE